MEDAVVINNSDNLYTLKCCVGRKERKGITVEKNRSAPDYLFFLFLINVEKLLTICALTIDNLGKFQPLTGFVFHP